MKFNVDVIKNWIKPNLNIKNITNNLTLMGFESYIDKNIVDISVPHNRNNCSNLFNLYYDYLNNVELNRYYNINLEFKNNINIVINNKNFCPLYYGIIIKNVNIKSKLPNYIYNTLLINNLNIVNPVIDIINYVMLISGQPLHAYDFDSIHGNIEIKKLSNSTKLLLLNNQIIDVQPNTYVIHDKSKIIALPGIIGSDSSKVTDITKNIFLESAFFNNEDIYHISHRYGINTTASNVFISGLNIEFTKFSLYYSSYLIKNLLNGSCSNIKEKNFKTYLPKNKFININKLQIKKIIGYNINKNKLSKILLNLKFFYKKIYNYWKIIIPYYRKDLDNTTSIISEIIKIYNYENIFCLPIKNSFIYKRKYNTTTLKNLLTSFLANHGFYEVITYSFVNDIIENMFYPNEKFLYIKNPMSNQMNVMRFGLLQGLLKTLQYNLNRKHDDISIFELGNIFNRNSFGNININFVLAGVISINHDAYDKSFFMIKKLLEIILLKFFKIKKFEINISHLPFFDKDINANISKNGINLGYLGKVKKDVLNKFLIKKNVYFFQLNLDIENLLISNDSIKISKYPITSRDISIIVDKNIKYNNLVDFIKSLNIKFIKNIFLYDLYLFDNNKFKTITLRLIFQSLTKTLVYYEIDDIMSFLQKVIIKKFNATIKFK